MSESNPPEDDIVADAVADLAAELEDFPTIYYDAERKEYLMKNGSDRWLAFNQAQMKRKLRARGYSAKAGDAPISDVERLLERAEENFDVGYAGPLAGKKAGFYQENGLRYLVTTGPAFIESAPGKFLVLTGILEGLFVHGEDRELGRQQLEIFFGWLRHGIKSLRTGKLTQAQALAICGPANSGKSLLQKIITKLLGGRSAKGARYMTGRTEFNSELCAAEHLILEDEHMTKKAADRQRFATQLKNVTVSTDTISCHRKGRQAVNLPIWWRVTITLNDNPEDLRILPPLNESVRDKIIILRAHSAKMPMPTTTPDERAAFWQAIESELPAFLHFLLVETQTPEELHDPRYGVSTWHHSALTSALYEISPEAHLLKMIDLILWETGRNEWEGSAEDLRAILMGDERTRRDAQALMGSVTACGTYLGRLAKGEHTRGRVESFRTSSTRGWMIRKEEI